MSETNNTETPKIPPLYFAHDPDYGLRYYDTPEEAKNQAEKSYLSAECLLDDPTFDPDAEGDTCWGVVLGHVVSHERPLTEEEKAETPDVDVCRELEWVDVPDPAAEIEAMREAMQAAYAALISFGDHTHQKHTCSPTECFCRVGKLKTALAKLQPFVKP